MASFAFADLLHAICYFKNGKGWREMVVIRSTPYLVFLIRKSDIPAIFTPYMSIPYQLKSSDPTIKGSLSVYTRVKGLLDLEKSIYVR